MTRSSREQRSATVETEPDECVQLEPFARLGRRRGLSSSRSGFIATLTRRCAENEAYAADCAG